MKTQQPDYTAGFTPLQRLWFYTLWGFVRLHSLLPLWVLYRFSDLLFPLLYYVVRYRRRLVHRNLESSFPDRSPREIHAIERQFYRWFCDYIYETIKLPGISRDEMLRRVTYQGMDHLNDLFSQGYSVTLYLGHYCNWEWVTSIGLHLPADVHGGQIYHVLEDPVFDALLLRIRATMGTESISMRNILRHVVQNRRAGQKVTLGFISDQIPLYQSAHYWVDFLNHPETLVITGTERITKQVGYACVYLDMSRTRRGYYNIDIVPMATDTKAIPDWELTRQYFRHLEASIRRQPPFWLWTHNRWKRDLKGLQEFNRTQNKTHNREE